VAAAARRLQSIANSTATPDRLAGPARAAIAEQSRQLEQLNILRAAWERTNAARTQLPELKRAVFAAQEAAAQADAALVTIVTEGERAVSASALSGQARDIEALVTLGRRLGLHNGHCPLCASGQTDADFENGLALAESYAKQLDQKAVEQAKRERARDSAATAAAAAQEYLEQRQQVLRESEDIVNEFEQRLHAAGLPLNTDVNSLEQRQSALRVHLGDAQQLLNRV
jgi:chromosome segregation protein